MLFIDKRIKVICEELKKLAIVSEDSIEQLKCKKGRYFYPAEAEAAVEPYINFEQGQSKWYGPDKHYWFCADYTIPEKMKGKTLQLQVKTQIEEWDDGKNPQFLLFVNGDIVQGLDMNHRTVTICEQASPGETLHLEMQAYTGTLHGEFDLFINMQQVDRAIKKLYFDLLVPLQAFERMDADDKTRHLIENILNNTINYLDLRTPYNESFYHSLEQADRYLSKALYEDLAGYDDVIATCIGHTHIDVAWWWTVEQTREKVARSFATVLKLMEEYPNYKFMSSQPQLYLYLKERYPKLYEQIKARIKEGRWEAEGGMWLEADTNLTSGESLVRQFLYGKKFFRDEFGIDSKILWLPDVFGYSGALPQIMKKSGIEYFMTTKLSWNQCNKIPNDTFMWRGIDGSGVFTHLITTLGVGQSSTDFFTTYNGNLHPDAIMGGYQRYQNKDINSDLLICFGHGDGGGGPTSEMLETSQRMEKGIKGIPKVRMEFSKDYFDQLYERVKDNRRLPVWEGELYFEYHRGTYTSMARNKKSNRRSENMMMDLEFLCVLASLQGMAYPYQKIDDMWKVILLNQFHDILPGSSIHEVYEVTKQEYLELADAGEALKSECLSVLKKDAKAVTIINTLGFCRDDVVRLDHSYSGSLKDKAGVLYPIQQGDTDSFVYLTNLPAKGFKTYEMIAKQVTESPFKKESHRLETPFYLIELDEEGMFTRIFDKASQREVLQPGKRGNVLCMYEDKPIYYDNWDIDIFYTEKMWEAHQLTSMQWTLEGPVAIVLEIKRTISNSTIDQKIYFYADSRRIDFETHVDWKEHQHLLKVQFPLDIHSDEAAFDIQFGNLTRKVHQNTSWDVARFETCGQKWIDFSEGHYGVSLLNDCKYGHSVKDGVLQLSLIKSGIEPNPVADQEVHDFTYSLYPHAGSLRECDSVWEGYKLNVPALWVDAAVVDDSVSFVSVDRKNVMLETIKAAEDGRGIIIRMYEYENTQTKVKVSFGMDNKLAAVKECNLMEVDEETKITCNETEFELTIRPYEIKTYRVIFS
jgi:alpha-mannosidase